MRLFAIVFTGFLVNNLDVPADTPVIIPRPVPPNPDKIPLVNLLILFLLNKFLVCVSIDAISLSVIDGFSEIFLIVSTNFFCSCVAATFSTCLLTFKNACCLLFSGNNLISAIPDIITGSVTACTFNTFCRACNICICVWACAFRGCVCRVSIVFMDCLNLLVFIPGTCTGARDDA